MYAWERCRSQQHASVPKHDVLNDIDSDGHDVASDDGDQTELYEAIAAPYTLEVLARKHERCDREDELEMSQRLGQDG